MPSAINSYVGDLIECDQSVAFRWWVFNDHFLSVWALKIDGRLAQVIFSFPWSNSLASGFLIFGVDCLPFELIVVLQPSDNTFFLQSWSFWWNPSLFLMSFNHSFCFKNFLAWPANLCFFVLVTLYTLIEDLFLFQRLQTILEPFSAESAIFNAFLWFLREFVFFLRFPAGELIFILHTSF